MNRHGGDGFALGFAVVFVVVYVGGKLFNELDKDSLLILAGAVGFLGGIMGHLAEKGLLSDRKGAALTAHLYKDSYGGIDLLAEPSSERPQLSAGEIACPRCPDVALHDRECPDCRGNLWDAAAVQEFARTHLHFDRVDDLREFALGEPESPLVCPLCTQQMKLVRLKGQQVDLCLGCGSLWADDTETAAIEAAANLMR